MTGYNCFILLEFLLISLWFASAANDLWVWKCNSSAGLCTRYSNEIVQNGESYPSIEVCRLVCGDYGALWPQPKKIAVLDRNLKKFAAKSIHFGIPQDTIIEDFLSKNIQIFNATITTEDTSICPEDNSVQVDFSIDSNNDALNWDTDESYDLNIVTDENVIYINIKSKTMYGARHALETLSQLIEFYPNNDDTICLAMVQGVDINDAPRYPHRGLLLDSARNFLTVDNIKRHIDAMAASKLNVLHWHVTDSQSFPLELPNLPNMTKYGAYDNDKIYHKYEVVDLHSYAKLRGVRIITEIDAPAHAGNGWQWGPEAGLGNLSVCVNQIPYRSFCIEAPCGQLNPINSKLYDVLYQLYKDITDMSSEHDAFHMGGDELFIDCWNSTQEIIDYLARRKIPRTTESFLDLWSNFQDNALKSYDKAVGNLRTQIILWTSHLTDVAVIEKYLDKERYVIQTWVPADDKLPEMLLDLGYQIIVSTKDAWYLDHGFWGVTTYHDWRTVYSNVIPQGIGTLGGEVCMWGEYVDSSSVESRTWPRAAAAAERLWSDPSTNTAKAEQRFYRHRERLLARGINAEALTVRWCYQNEGQCS